MKYRNFNIYWPYFVFGLFIFVIVVNISYLLIANKTWRGIFTENSYTKGLNHNKTLNKVKEQNKLGILINTSIKKKYNNNFNLETYLKDNKNNFIADFNVIYLFRYLPDSAFDFNVNAENGDRIFKRASVVLNKSGDWEVETAVSYQDHVIQDIRFLKVDLTTNDVSNSENYEK